MVAYITKQRKVLLDFLSNHPHEIFSAVQIMDHIKVEKLSLSSIYRNLSELEVAEMIRKISKSGSREAYYQYIDKESCNKQVHLFCKKCEKLYHTDKENVESFSKQIFEVDGFTVDQANTIIYGVCKNCKNM